MGASLFNDNNSVLCHQLCWSVYFSTSQQMCLWPSTLTLGVGEGVGCDLTLALGCGWCL